jgi:hypothetical protein
MSQIPRDDTKTPDEGVVDAAAAAPAWAKIGRGCLLTPVMLWCLVEPA